MVITQQELMTQITLRGDRMRKFVAEQDYLNNIITSEHLRRASGDYFSRGGKSLRPAVTMFAAGALGGDENSAVPAAAAIEVSHNWTLIHDDIIDRDRLRRGKPTSHTEMTSAGQDDLGLSNEVAEHYGLSMAILGGDIGQCWAIYLLGQLGHDSTLPPTLAGHLIEKLVTDCIPAILVGETEDIQQSYAPLSEITIEEVEGMLTRKTGVLYEYCCYAGGMIGAKATPDSVPDEVIALASYARLAGTAFQFIDDTLGYIVSDEAMGKPALSDLREGKRTAVVLGAYANADPSQKQKIEQNLGRDDATDAELEKLQHLIIELGGVSYAKTLAKKRFDEAFEQLTKIPNGEYRNLLEAWGLFLLNRKH